MSDNVYSVYLGSQTVFYEDLGVDMQSEDSRKAAAPHFFEMTEWLEEHTKRAFNCHQAGIWFLDAEDAMLFKLTWAGMLK